MEKEDIKKILRYPYRPLVMLALQLVNLKDKEYNSIELVDIRGYSEQEASEKLNISLSSIKRYRKSAYLKMSKAWDNKTIIEKILKEG